MKASSLQLETSAFTRIRLEANREFPQERTLQAFDAFAQAGLNSKVEISESEGEDKRHFVKLEVLLPGTEDTPSPYIIDMEILGVFRCNSTRPDVDKFIESNGPAVLYGSIREMVSLLTSRGPFPPLVLPTVTFIPPEVQVDGNGHRVPETPTPSTAAPEES